MLRLLVAGFLAVAPIAAHAQSEEQQLVDRASLAVQDLANDRDGTEAQSVLRRVRAVMICPRVLKAGFLLGGMGGDCVLAARDAAGSWSSPAFYSLGGVSLGFQAGLEDAQVMLFIMTDHGLRAVMDTQVKLGANAGVTFADLGGGVEGATSLALQSDIIGFSRARGLYAGIALSGSILAADSKANQSYYGRPVGVQQVVLTMEAANPSADPLRVVLSRYGSQGAAPGGAPPLQLQGQGPGPISAPPPTRGAVSAQPLAAPSRRY